MNTGFRSQCVPSYRLLTEDQIREIHLATLEVLETVGVRVAHQEAIGMLRDAGCRIVDGDTARIPNWLVEESILSAPSRITIYNRKGQEAMRLEGRNSYYGMGTDLIETYDLKTGQLRETRLQDVVNAARVADHCENIDFIASYALPHDVPTNTMYVECFKAQVENSLKPIFFTAAGLEDLNVMFEMAEAVAGGQEALRRKPFLIHYSEPTPPLVHSNSAVQKLFLCADRELPINYTPFDSMGGGAPVTLAGGVVQGNAEALSGIVLHQLRRKGAPIISGFTVAPLDMKTSAFCYGAPEYRLTNSVFADLCHYYGLPMWSTVGSDAVALDEQAAAEHAMSTLLATLDGANLIHDVGYMAQGLVGHPAMLVLCDEIIAYVRRVTRGFEFTRELAGIDVMRKVGPGGNYLSEDHTLKYFKQEHWRPSLFNRYTPDVWREKGSKSCRESAIEKTLHILETHRAEPLAPDVQSRIDEIARRAEKELTGRLFKA